MRILDSYGVLYDADNVHDMCICSLDLYKGDSIRNLVKNFTYLKSLANIIEMNKMKHTLSIITHYYCSHLVFLIFLTFPCYFRL